MPASFKPLRQKTGVVTLMVACLFAAGWVRSSLLYDGIWLLSHKSRYGITSTQGRLCWHYAHSPQARRTDWQFKWDSTKRMRKVSDEVTDHFLNRILHDFSFVSDTAEWGYPADLVQTPGPTVQAQWSAVQVPYWSIAIPLGLLSLWLLTSKPRKPVSAEEPA